MKCYTKDELKTGERKDESVCVCVLGMQMINSLIVRWLNLSIN